MSETTSNGKAKILIVDDMSENLHTMMINSPLPTATGESRRGPPLWLLTTITLVLVGGWLGWDARQDYQAMIEREYTLLDIAVRNRATHITGLVRSSELMPVSYTHLTLPTKRIV